MDQGTQAGKKDEIKGGGIRPPGGLSSGGRTALIVGGITALALLAIVAFAVMSTGGGGGADQEGGGGAAQSFTPNDQGLLPVGSQAPDFTAQRAGGGGEVALGDRGGPTMLVFFATWCPHCQEEAPVIAELEDQHADLRAIMVGIDGEDDPAKVQEFVQSYGLRGPAIYEPSLGQTYQVSGYPTIYVVNGGGEIVAAHSGEVPKEVLASWIGEAS